MKKFLSAIALSTLVSTFHTYACESGLLSNSLSESGYRVQLKHDVVVFSGTSNPLLAQEIASHLKIDMGYATVGRFNDKEIQVQLHDTVRNKNVYIIASTCTTSTGSVNDHLMEVIAMVDAAKRAWAGSITAVLPYYGYARQDRKSDGRVPIMAKTVAVMLESVGINRLISLDLHCGQIQGFFQIPVDNLPGWKIFADYIKSLKLNDLVIVSPDAGGGDRVRKLRNRLDIIEVPTEYAMIDKERAQAGIVGSMTLIGNVKGKNAIIVDDMCDTGGTLIKAAQELKLAGALSVYACVTHGVFSNGALTKIRDSMFDQVIVTDTIPIEGDVPANVKVLSVAQLLARTIDCIENDNSISDMLNHID